MATTFVSSGVMSSGVFESGAGNTLEVLSGGTASVTTVVGGGTLQVNAGGLASGTFISSSGFDNVLGADAFVTLNSSGTLNVSAGGTVHDVIASGGQINLSGTTTSNVYLFTGATETVASGGVASGAMGSGTRVSGGTLNIQSGGALAFSTDYSGGITNISSGGTAHNLAISSGGTLNVAGTVTSDVVVSGGGIENVLSGGLITGQVFSGSGNFGTAISGGTVSVFAGGSAAFLGVSAGGMLNVAGTVLNNVGVYSGGIENVSSGGLISGASGSGTGISGGTVNLLAGGSAAFVGVSSGGTFNVLGTVLSNVAVFSGGIENVSSGGVVTGIPNSGTGISGGTINVLSSGALDHGVISSGGTLNVSAGGTVHDVTVSNGGTLNVAGTITSNVTVSSGGIENILAGGLISAFSPAAGTTVSAGGTLNVLGTTSNTVLVFSGGVENVSSGGSINGPAGTGTFIAAGATLNVLAGGSAGDINVSGLLNVLGTITNNVAVNSGGIENVSSGGLISGAPGSGTGISGGTVNVLAGGSAAFVGVSSGGIFNVQGTVLSNVAVYSGGIENILSGGAVTGVTGSGTGISGGTVNVLSGGALDHLTVSSGALNVSAGGVAHHLTVSSGGTINVAGTLTSDVIVSSGGIENVLFGGLITGQVFSGSGDFGTSDQGTVNVSSGGSAAFLGVSAGAALNVSAGGIASHITVSSGGVLNVAGTITSNVGVVTGGIENVSSGGLISGTFGSGTGIAGGTVNLLAGGSAAFVGVSSGGTFNVLGTVLSNVAVFSGGIENVSSGGVVTGVPNSGTGISGGTVNVLSGGALDHAAVSSGGILNISAGGTAHNMTVSSGGFLNVAGTITGNVLVVSGGTETVSSGGTTSGTTIAGGTVELTSGGSAGNSIVFAGTGGLLKIDAATMPSTVISGLVAGDTIDLAGATFASGGTVQLQSGNVLKIVENGVTYNLNLDPAANFAGEQFKVTADTGTGTNVNNYLDHAPVVTAPSISATHNQSFAASSLFSVTDADGDTITNYEFYDATGSGHFVVGGAPQAAATVIDVTAAQLASTTYQSGSGSDQLYVRASDGVLWSAWQAFTVTAPVDQAPVVTAANAAIATGQSVAASSLFTAVDPEGDTITKYEFYDATGSGHFVVGGAPQAAATVIDVTAAQLAATSYLAGSATDQLYVRANDGTLWSTWQPFTAGPTAPLVTAPNVTATHNQSFAASSLFAASDPDGDTLTSYEFYDVNGNGYFVVGGVAQGSGVVIDVTAAQLASTVYQSGSGSDQLYVRANDGTLWSAWQPFTVTAPIDQAPVVTAPNVTATHNQSFAASSLFSVTDAENDTITKYEFYDATGNGHFVVGGVAQGSGVVIDVTAAQLASTAYQSGSGSDQLYVRANDGTLWSAWQPFTVTAPIDQAPVVSASNLAAAHNQSLAASSLFSVTDAENDTITKYEFYDATGNGHFVVGGVAQGSGVVIDVTAAQLASTAYQSGSGSDQLYVRANDGTLWSAWQPFTVTAPIDQAPVVSASNLAAAHNQSLAASSLFSVTDAENDTITKYEFYDATGNGHFVVGGVAQGSGVVIDVTAAQLASTAYQSGSGSDQLYVRANDGTLWSSWQPFTVAAPLDQAPVVTATNAAIATGHSQAASSLFSVTDAENDTITKYEFYDATGSGHFVVGGAPQAAATVIDVTAAQLATTSYLAGSATDQLYVRANDGTLWSSWQPFTAGPTAPVVTASNAAIATGNSVAASSLFTASDPDGDTLTSYEFYDLTGSGHFVVGGAAQAAATVIDVTAAQLATTSYLAGSATDQLYVRANDGTLWSSWQPFTAGPTAPVVTASNAAIATGNSVAASSLFTASDPDGDTLTSYEFYDLTGSGHFVVGGAAQAAATVIDVTAAQLATTSYLAGSATDQLYVRANDGTLWSSWQPFTAGPTAPVVTASNAPIATGNSVAASSLFTASDPDGDTLNKYEFYDATGSGHFVVGGVTQGSGVVIDVTAAQLATTSYLAGSATDQLYVRANDGTLWSSWQPFTAGPTAPVVTASNLTTVPGQTFAASSLFAASDPDGDTLTKYEFYDATGSGHFVVGGVAQAAATVIDVTAAQLATTSYASGSGTDQLYARANDGTAWSTWQPFTASGEAPAIINAGSTLELAGAYAEQVTFFGSTGTLKLDNPSSFAGTVAGMTAQDAIDFTNLNFATIQTPSFSGSSSGGTLTVTDGSHTDQIALLGNYLASTFVPSSDGHGGTSVIDPPAANNQNNPLALSQHA